MKVKIRLKIDEKRMKSIPAYRRIIVGEIKAFPSDKFLPESIKNNFFFVDGKNFYVDQPRKTAEIVQEETKEMLIPIKEVRSITVLPENFDFENIQYEVVGSRLICKTTKQEVPIKEEGEII